MSLNIYRASFISFNKAVYRFPRTWVSVSNRQFENLPTDPNDKFNKRISKYPSWLPLKIKVYLGMGVGAWHMSNINFGDNLMYRMYQEMSASKVSNDLVVFLIQQQWITEKEMEEFCDYEDKTRNGNFVGAGRVYDLYDHIYHYLELNRPYESTWKQLRQFDYLSDENFKRLLPKLRLLDEVLRKTDCVAYRDSMADVLLADVGEEYLTGKVSAVEGVSLKKIVGEVNE